MHLSMSTKVGLEMKMHKCEKHGEFHQEELSFNGKKLPVACPKCVDEIIEEERKSDIEKIKRQSLEARKIEVFNQSCVPKRYQFNSFKDYSPVCEDAEKVTELLKRYVNNFDKAIERGTSFLFSGGTGTGKTTLATAVLNNVMRMGYTGVYVSSLNYISRIKRSWTTGSNESEDELIESFVKFDLLVIDELGKGGGSASEKGMIFRLLDRRHEEMKPTIGVSIHDEKTITKLIDQDAVRRLTTGGGGILRFTWPNYELNQRRF